jgi:hypothetical protein
MIKINLFCFICRLVLPKFSLFFEFFISNQRWTIIYLFFGFPLRLCILLLKFFDQFFDFKIAIMSLSMLGHQFGKFFLFSLNLFSQFKNSFFITIISGIFITRRLTLFLYYISITFLELLDLQT